MKYLSVCSGIEAATTAWHPLGWQPVAFSEIEPFPSAVLAHHWPDVPNLGDMTHHHDWTERTGPIRLLVGGTPCQAFSVAGLRQGLADPRGNLTLTYLALVAQYRPLWVVWENVPGVLSDRTGAFGSLLGGLAELGYGWAYRVLDAQYVRVESHPHAVPQRRRRVFVVGCLGGWAAAAAVLFERESLRGHPPPRREAGKGFACYSKTGPGAGVGWPSDVASTLRRENGSPGYSNQDLFSQNAANFVPDVSYALAAGQGGSKFGSGRHNQDVLIPQVAGTLQNNGKAAGSATQQDAESGLLVANTLRAEGFDASEDGTGRQNLVPGIIPFDTTQITSTANRSHPQPGAPCHPISESAHPPAIAFSCKDHGADAGELSPTPRSMGHASSRANGGGQVAVAQCLSDVQGQGSQPIAFSGRARGDDGRGYDRPPQVFESGAVGTLDTVKPHCVAFQPRIARNGRGDMGEVVNALQAQSGGTGKGDAAPCVAFEPRYYTRDNKTGGQPSDTAVLKADACKAGDSSPHIATPYTVRRLTPRECERLQGFPDDHTLIPWRGKPADQCPDGPRYKALGNSMAVNVMAWLGQRIAFVETLLLR